MLGSSGFCDLCSVKFLFLAVSLLRMRFLTYRCPHRAYTVIVMARQVLSLCEMPDLVLLRVADFLVAEDTARLSMTCRRLRDLLPRFLVIRGKDFSAGGSGTGWGDVEPYFDGPRLPAGVKRLTMSVAGWKDQGWGNRKGELFVRLMRPDPGEHPEKGKDEGSAISRLAGRLFSRREKSPQRTTGGKMVAERRDFFGLAEHRETSARLEMDGTESVVGWARCGDWYRFMRRVGGGGGHELIVRGFRAVVMLESRLE